MTRLHTHTERHAMERIGWLRAAVLGANDGIVSTSNLIVGIAAGSAEHGAIVSAGVAGLVAGALSMAAGEYVSVRSQADTEATDLARERQELADQPEAELTELASIYVERGLSAQLALQVAQELTAKDALAAHARDELGIVQHLSANPLHAAWTSAATFAVGAAVPLSSRRAHAARHAAVGHNGGDRRGARRARGPKRVDGRGGHRETRAARALLGRTGNGGYVRGRVPVRAGRLGGPRTARASLRGSRRSASPNTSAAVIDSAATTSRPT